MGFGVALTIIVAEFIYRRKAMEKPQDPDDGYHLNGS